MIRWTKEEEGLLIQAAVEFPDDWDRVSERLRELVGKGKARSASSCVWKWKLVMKERGMEVKGRKYKSKKKVVFEEEDDESDAGSSIVSPLLSTHGMYSFMHYRS